MAKTEEIGLGIRAQAATPDRCRGSSEIGVLESRLQVVPMEKVLIVRTSALGDVLHGIPVAAALKERFPACRITWVVDERYGELLAGQPWVDEIVRIRLQGGIRSLLNDRGRRNWMGVARTLRRSRFDVAVDLQGLLRSGLIAYLTGAPLRIGFPRGYAREPLNRVFTNLRPRNMPPRSHVIDRNLALLHPLGIRTHRKRFCLRVPPSVEDEVRPYLHKADEGRDVFRVAVNPAAGWATKRWSPHRFAEIADRMVEQWGALVFLLWGPGERELAEQVRRHARRPVHLVPEMGLTTLAAFLKGCDVFVGGDSGPLHLASALGVPVLGLFGPSDPVRNGPFGDGDRVVTAAAPCGPCYKRKCARASCMDSISVEQVWEVLEEEACSFVRGRRQGKGLRTAKTH
jgi:lipopolysaccharide heptosyltransferase I